MRTPNKHDWSDIFDGNVCRICSRWIPTGAGKSEHARKHAREGRVVRVGEGTAANPYRYKAVPTTNEQAQPKPAEPVRRWVSISSGRLFEYRNGQVWHVSEPHITGETLADMARWVASGYYREIGPEVATPGLRLLCSWCKTDLPGSDHKGWRRSDGICPQCAEKMKGQP